MGEIKEVLARNEFRFNKQFGQNFITDTNLLSAIVSDANIGEGDTVLEIGAGAGTLTKALSSVAKRVVSFEIDKNLEVILEQTLKDCHNASVIFKDFQKVSDEELLSLVGKEYKVVANLPYYITTPIIMRLLEGKAVPKSITVMVQKEVAERFCADEGTEDYGAITVACRLQTNAEITRTVKRQMFYPIPNVDSAVIRFDIVEKYTDIEIKAAKRLAKAAFAMRRKTLLNNILASFSLEKEIICKALAEADIKEGVRGETLSVEEFVKLGIVLAKAEN